MPASTEPLASDDLVKLQSLEHLQLLDVVDELRAQGLSGLLPLPQLIVCGDQSSGKSSVLEAISGIPFPKKDNLCTRFATEVILRRDEASPKQHITVSIVPGSLRSDTEKKRLSTFAHDLTSVDDLPHIITEAQAAMGLDSENMAFSKDVLRLEVTGPRMPQLTIVDLPGLIHSENKMQTAQDVEVVAELVENYMEQKRSIILAVISAKNDYANQIVLKKARSFDPSGKRTLGIITKPDTLWKGSDSEMAYLELARNEDIKFALGWHVMRNIDSNATKSEGNRDEQEMTFFRHSKWQTIGESLLGAQSLRDRLSRVLFDQIKAELPNLINDIESSIVDCTSGLTRLGRSRTSEKEQELFLIEVGQAFQALCKASCDGPYEDPFFGQVSSVQGEQKRLRAFIQNESMKFAKVLATRASSWVISDTTDDASRVLSRQQTLEHVTKLIKGSRGRELPGTFNPLLIGELFREYSAPWKKLAHDHLFLIWQFSKAFVDVVIESITDEDVRDALFRLVIGPELDQLLVSADARLTSFLDELRQHPITYNHYLTDTVAKARNDRREAALRSRIGTKVFSHDQIQQLGIEGILGLIREPVDPDMDHVAAETTLDYMLAYYKVAHKRLSDNIPALIIETEILSKLPVLLEPAKILHLGTSVVHEIAGESSLRQDQRTQLENKLSILRRGEATCKRYVSRSVTKDITNDSTLDQDEPDTTAEMTPDTSNDAEPVGPVPAESPDIDADNWGLSSKAQKKKKNKNPYAWD